MKKLFNLILGLLCLSILVSSCTKEENLTNNTREAQVYRNPHRIPQATALAELKAFLDEDPATKGSKSRTIKTVEALTETVPATKSSQGGLDTTLYLVNFDNDEGYAVLAADDRISAMIIAVAEKGELHPEDFLSVKAKRDTVLQYTDTLGIVRTINYYNEEEDDYYVGRVSDGRTIQELMYDYVQNELDNSGNRDGSEEPKPMVGVRYNWVTTKYKPMMLQTLWNQESDTYHYNKYCPKFLWQRAPTGCVPVAMAQIMAYHEFPKVYRGQKLDWKLMKTVHNSNDRYFVPSENAINMLAWLLRNLGKDTKAIYAGELGFTFAFPIDAKRALVSYGYRNAKRHIGYTEKNILKSLDKGNPVFIAALDDLRSAHAWVIDGYRHQERLDDLGNVESTRTLLHCNWGWDGQCNGYYSSNIFSLCYGAKEYEDPIEEYYQGDDKKDLHYNWWFRIITFEKPY